MIEAYICTIGDDDADELIYTGDNLMDLDDAIAAHDEVDTDLDKYFLINDFQFWTYADFDDNRHLIHSMID